MEYLNFPGESAEYRAARNKILIEEMALRRKIESVAALGRALPADGTVLQKTTNMEAIRIISTPSLAFP